MPEYIEKEADGFKYYVVRNKVTGQYFRGKGENKWGKYYNQASIYRFKKHAENAVVELAHRGEQAEVVEIRITNAADVVEVRHGEWITHTNSDGNLNHYECSVCHRSQGYLSNYCEDCGAKMDGKGDG